MHKSSFYPFFPPILHNPIPCGKATGRRVSENADSFLGDAHDAAHSFIVFTQFIEEMEEKLSQTA